MIGKLKAVNNGFLLNIDHEIGRYYRKLFLRTFGIKLQRPSHSEHISVISRHDCANYPGLLLVYNNCLIEFDLDMTVYTNGNAFWLNVITERLVQLRIIARGIYNQNLHFCIGYLNNGIIE